MRLFGYCRSRADLRLGRLCASIAGVVCFLLLPGCGSGSGDLVRVSGTVSYQGSPLEHGSLRFFGPDSRPIGCVIRQDGSYEINLPPGDFQVSVSSPPRRPASDPTDDTPPPPDPNALPEIFSQPVTSGLTFSVGPQAEPLTYNIDLKRPTRHSRR
jgi:hypothetical protein